MHSVEAGQLVLGEQYYEQHLVAGEVPAVADKQPLGAAQGAHHLEVN